MPIKMEFEVDDKLVQSVVTTVRNMHLHEAVLYVHNLTGFDVVVCTRWITALAEKHPTSLLGASLKATGNLTQLKGK